MDRTKLIIRALNAIAGTTKSAAQAVDLIPPQNHGNIVPVMDYNHKVYGLLQRVANPDLHWRDDAMRFLLKETVPHNGFWMSEHKLNAFRSSVSWADRTECDKHLEPLRNLLVELGSLRARFAYDRMSCLIVTALPVELRAVVRRVLLFLGCSDEFAIDRNLDKANDEQKDQRKCAWLECVIFDDAKYAKVSVLCPARDGSPFTEKAIHQHLTQTKHVFDHVFVVGIAGQLDKTKGVDIGDVVFSTGFYDTHRRKMTTAVKSGIDFSRPGPINCRHAPQVDLSHWKPKTVYADKPKSRLPGFRIAKPGLVVSGPDLVKKPSYKKILQERFPDALAVEMELAGCNWAVGDSGIPVTMIKSICDHSIHTKSDVWHSYCADYAAELAVEYILQVYGKPFAAGHNSDSSENGSVVGSLETCNSHVA